MFEINTENEYRIPEEIKGLITDEFLKEFRNQLFRIFNHFSLDAFMESGVTIATSHGWIASFGKACLLTSNEKVLNYWRSLDWYSSDRFNGEIYDMLIDKGLVLCDIFSLIEEKMGIKKEDLVYCSDCGKLYAKDMVVKVEEENEDDVFYTRYRCFHCQDMKDTKEENRISTDYYRNALLELDEYNKKNPIIRKQKIKAHCNVNLK